MLGYKALSAVSSEPLQTLGFSCWAVQELARVEWMGTELQKQAWRQL